MTEPTQILVRSPRGLERRRVWLQVLGGGNDGLRVELDDERLTIGALPEAGLRLEDPTVSRHHAELVASADGLLLRDLGSTNGTWVGSLRVREVLLPAACELRFGAVRVGLSTLDETVPVELSPSDTFGRLFGRAPAMRALFHRLERAAASDATVLLTGESGTGKELAARALHDRGRRKGGPFVVVDCGALPRELIESELFGHEKGAFTGAVQGRQGAFEEANGGTVFLDEIGELDLDLQPRLLRVLESRQVKRLGGRGYRPVDIRVVAATHRDLLRRVAEGSFREDLYHRLAVVTLRLPPLRERREDISVLVRRFLDEHGPELELSPDVLQRLEARPWPGNVRELRNFVERMVALGEPPSVPAATVSPAAAPLDGLDEPYKIVRARLLDDFERRYLLRLLDRSEGNYTKAARLAEIDRVYLLRLLDRHDLRNKV